jgi:hypothetical protein
MKYRHIFAITAVAICLLRTAIADIGSLSCSDIGEVAAAIVVGKERGSSLKDQLLKIEIRTKDSPTMRKILSDIATQIYTAPWADKLSEHGARMAFTADCRARRLRSVQARRV